MTYQILQTDRGVKPEKKVQVRFELSQISELVKPTHVLKLLVTYHVPMGYHKFYIN